MLVVEKKIRSIFHLLPAMNVKWKKSNKKEKMIMALTCSALKGNLSIYHPESSYMIGKAWIIEYKKELIEVKKYLLASFEMLKY